MISKEDLFQEQPQEELPWEAPKEVHQPEGEFPLDKEDVKVLDKILEQVNKDPKAGVKYLHSN